MQKRHQAITRPILAAALCLMILLTMNTTVWAVDLNQPNSLTVTSVASTSEYREDVAEANVVIDLYLLATAVPVTGIDSYGYRFDPESADSAITIGDISMDVLDTGNVSLAGEQWNDLAQQAAAIARQGAYKVVESVPTGQKISGLTAGLYLIIAHGEGITDYWTTREDEYGRQQIITVAETESYTYAFAPSVIALPTKNAATDANGDVIINEAGMPDINTADSYGDWIYDASASLKPTVTPRYGGLTVVKTIDQFKGDEEVTFVFRVTASAPEGKVFPDDPDYSYSNVVAVAFNASTGLSTTAVVDRIRAGAAVSVEEIYTGLRYKAGTMTAPESNIVVPGSTDALVFTANNTFDNDTSGGHGIQNHFTLVEGRDGNSWNAVQQTAASGLNR